MLFSLPLHADSKPTVETLGPTLKSDETTTPYPMDEDITECGENCSFEDGKHGDAHHSSRVAWVWTRQMARDRARGIYRRVRGGATTQRPEAVAARNTRILYRLV